MPYSYLTRAQAKAILAERLYDTGKVFFADSELNGYLNEALQTFNALANFYRGEFTFNSRANVTWYDLTDAVNNPNTTRPMTMTDQDVLSAIEYHFLEPQTSTYPLAWTGSAQFTVQDILNAIQQVRDEVLSESNCTVTEYLVAALSGRTFLSDSMLDVRRVCWIPTTGLGYSSNCLMPADLWSTQAFNAGFPQKLAAIPQIWRRSTEPPLSFDVDIQPAVPGSYDVLVINGGGSLSTSSATVLPVPNDWVWVIKWGAMAQLLARDSVANDPLRAKYCLLRYKQGLAAMQNAPALLGARINNVPVVVQAVTTGDFYNANWQGQTPGAPNQIYYSGLNLVALNTQPTTTGYSVTASTVSNMALPATDADFLQVGRDDVGAVIDEAQHIAMVKCGGAEFLLTLPLHQNLLRRCALYNSKLQASSLYLEFLDWAAKFDPRANPVFQGVTPETVES